MDLFDIAVASKLVGGGGGGGGSSSYTLLTSENIDIPEEPASTAANVVTIDCGSEAYTSDKMIFCAIRPNDGKPLAKSTYYGSDSILLNMWEAQSQAYELGNADRIVINYYTNNSSLMSKGIGTTAPTGIYAKSLTSAGELTLAVKGSSTIGAVKGGYIVKVYALDWPDNISPFA